MSTEKTEKKEKDFWDKVDIFLRPLNGLLTAVAVGLLGYYTSGIVRQQETRDSNERVYTQLMSSREQADSGLRKDMFLSIIQIFQRPEQIGLESKLLNLEMLAYNFHESLNLKPLFAHLEREIVSIKQPEKDAYIGRLNQVAREIASRQSLLLEEVGRKVTMNVDFGTLAESPGGLSLPPQKLSLENTEREFTVTVLDFSVERREITVQLSVRTPGRSDEVLKRVFHVSYYDFPMIDNTRLSQDQRAAVVVNQFAPGGAELSLLFFPGSYASLKEKVSYDEVVEKLRVMSQPK